MNFFQFLDTGLSRLLLAISEVPSTFWAVLVSTSITLLTVHLTNRGNTKRLERQLSHDRDLKKVERLFNAKREIYLDAAVAISLSLRSLANFANFELSHSELMKDANEKSAALAKVNLVASPETLRALAAVNRAVGNAVVELTALRRPLMVGYNGLRLMEQNRKNSQLRFEGLLELQHQKRVDGSISQGDIDRLIRLTDMTMDRANKSHQEWAEQDKTLRGQAMVVYQQALKYNASIAHLLPRLLEAIRIELDVPLETAVFQEIVDAASAHLDDIGQRFVDMQKGVSPSAKAAAT